MWHLITNSQLYSRKHCLFIIMLLLFGFTRTLAQDTISPAHRPLTTGNLKPGLRQYLVYYEVDGMNKQLWMSIWNREISKTVVNNTPVISTKQQWYNEDSTKFHESLSINNATDFSPVYHQQRSGDNVSAYQWSATGIRGDTTDGNKAKDFTLAFDGPNYNWNLDLETFEMLPLAAGKTFVVRFYDAGFDPPAYVTYRVVGTETIATLDNHTVTCWKLYTEGSSKRGKYTQTFWISCKNHECLKEEDRIGDRMHRYKVKLPAFAPILQKK
ncbi:DUF3108 domain-containing protein [Chitinophaga sp. Cy-1792]|uniref:DUF3108 domain-containing protein n=1 Tax=Chitinophaga sp. Cy-1792 TaxID=2608339 RepID=UPI00141DF0C8|nr:DUF3108 domain-containing protein [Chitinophaga sp. Cy-1792]NIG56664.1 DUF3108 domain-containing protein [Chitinophaga sp. Cy-1792]